MTTPPHRRLTDAAWIGLMAATCLAWLVFDGTLAGVHVAAALMALMWIKSLLILAIFMDLGRASHLALIGMGTLMGLLGLGIALQI